MNIRSNFRKHWTYKVLIRGSKKLRLFQKSLHLFETSDRDIDERDETGIYDEIELEVPEKSELMATLRHFVPSEI